MKKIFLVALVSLLLLTLSTGQSLAINNDNKLMISTEEIPKSVHDYVDKHYLEIFNILKNQPTDYKLSDLEVADLNIGQGFRTYKVDKNQIIDNNIFYFPVLHKNRIVGLINVIDYNGRYSIGYKKGFSAELNELRGNSIQNSYMLAYSDEDLFAFSKNGKTLVKKAKFKTDKEKGIISNDDVLKRLNNKDMVVKNIINYSSETVLGFSEDVSINSIIDEEYYINVPIVANQSIGGGICWAACIASEVNYINGTSYDALDIYNKHTYDSYTPSIFWNDRMDIYEDEGITDAEFLGNEINPDVLINELRNRRPIDCALENPADGGKHAVVVRGYIRYIYDTEYVSIMDPNDSSYVITELIVIEETNPSDDWCYFIVDLNGGQYGSEMHYINLE